jgi:hypothetical protein
MVSAAWKAEPERQSHFVKVNDVCRAHAKKSALLFASVTLWNFAVRSLNDLIPFSLRIAYPAAVVVHCSLGGFLVPLEVQK